MNQTYNPQYRINDDNPNTSVVLYYHMLITSWEIHQNYKEFMKPSLSFCESGEDTVS